MVALLSFLVSEVHFVTSMKLGDSVFADYRPLQKSQFLMTKYAIFFSAYIISLQNICVHYKNFVPFCELIIFLQHEIYFKL